MCVCFTEYIFFAFFFRSVIFCLSVISVRRHFIDVTQFVSLCPGDRYCANTIQLLRVLIGLDVNEENQEKTTTAQKQNYLAFMCIRAFSQPFFFLCTSVRVGLFFFFMNCYKRNTYIVYYMFLTLSFEYIFKLICVLSAFFLAA